MTAERRGVARKRTPTCRGRAWERWLLGALGLAGALAAAMTAHAHPDGNQAADPVTNLSVDFATGRATASRPHCIGSAYLQYRYSSTGGWTWGTNRFISQSFGWGATEAAVKDRDYVEARAVTSGDPPHCPHPAYTSAIVHARTTLATNRDALTRANLDRATLTVTLGSPATTLTTSSSSFATFGSGVGASGFELVTNPATPGLSFTVGAVTAGSRTATLTLSTGSNYVNPPTSVAVRVKAAAHSGSTALTSKTLPVQTNPGLRVGAVSGLATEGGGKATFPVRLWTQPSAAVTVSVSSRDTSEGTVAPSSITFSTTSWNTAQTVTVTGVDDNVNDGHVTWQVRLDPSSGDTDYDGLSNVVVGVTTLDDDLPLVSSTRWEGINVGTTDWSRMDVTTTSLRDEAARQSVTISFNGGGAVVWANFGVEACEWWAVTPGATGTTGACHTLLQEGHGVTSSAPLTLDVTPTPIMIHNGGVVIKVTLINHGNGMAEWVPLEGPSSALSLAPASISESGGVSTVTATLDRTRSAPTTIAVSAAAVASTGAVSGDFTQTGTTLTIAAGATTSTGTVTVTANDNDVDAPGKSVTVSGTAAGGDGVSSPPDVTLAITDDEALPTATLALSASSILESGEVSTVTAILSGASSEATTLTVSAAAVASTGAVVGDFTQTGTTLTIAAGATTSTGTATVTANDNAVDAANKQVAVSATAVGGHAVADPSAVTLTITDDDAAPDAVLSLSHAAVTENGGVATVSAALSHPSSEPSTVTVRAAAGFYTVGVDATITIAAGATTGGSNTATVRAVDDGVHQGSAGRRVTVTATLANGQGAGSVTGAGLTLRDDESLPVAGLVLAPSSVSESGGVSAVSATLSGASSEAVTLTVVAAAGPGAAAGDFTQSGTTLTLAAGETTSTGTVTVTANGNDVDAPDKTVTVSATAAGGNGVASPRDVTLTLIDDDVVTDLTTGRGSIVYAKETLTATLDSGGVTYYVVSSPPAPGRWSMTAPAGRAAAAGSTLQVRFVLGNMVFAGADAPTLSAPATGSSTPLSGVLVSGGTAGDPEAIFSVVVPTGRSIASDAVMALTVRSLGVRVDRAGTVRVGTRLGTSGAFSPGDPVPVVRVASGLRETAAPASPVTRIGDGFRTFAGKLVASVGRLSVGPPEGARLYRAADGAPAELEDMVSAAPGASRITFSGRLGFVEDVFLSATADCSTRDGEGVLDAGGAWAAVDLGNANHRRLCLEVDGTTSIPETGFYQASVDYTGIAGARFPPADVAGLGLGRVTRGGVTVHLSYVNTHPNVNFRVVVRNRMDEPAPYRFEFTPPEGTSAVGGPQAEGALPANALTLLRAANFVTVTGRRTWTGARLNVDASPERLDIVTIQTNRSDGSTDTVRYNVPDAPDR